MDGVGCAVIRCNPEENMKRTLFVLCAIVALSIGAAAQVVVTPTNTQGWSGTGDNTSDATVGYVVDSTAPAGVGALELKTSTATSSRAQYRHDAAVLLSDITELSYYTKTVAGPTFASAAYQLETCLNGLTGTTCNGYATLNFEPYQNSQEGAIIPGAWQQWDVDAGFFWSTRTRTCSNGTIQGANTGPQTLYTLAQIQAACPDAVVFNHYVNVGTNNPGYDIYVDLVDFNGTTYDFEPYPVARTQYQCKNNGWKSIFRADHSTFKNQGDCIQYVNTGK